MTKQSVLDIIERNMTGCYTCVYSCDEQGYNGEYHSESVDILFEKERYTGDYDPWCLLNDDWKLGSFQPITNEDIDIEEWAQEFDKETIEQLRKDIDDGIFYEAVFYNDSVGTQKILVWQY